MNEIWKDVTGFEGLYQVSNTGLVRSLDRKVEFNRDNATTMFKKGKLLKGKLTWDGYNEVCLINNNKKRKYIRTHRIVAKEFITNIDVDNLQVNHKDGDKLNNNIKNLEWVTAWGNSQHANKNKLINYAKGSQISKLSEKEVLEIRRLYQNKILNQRQIAKKFNVGKNCIWHIVKRNTWQHV